jgi:hypothetical protein
MKPGGAPVLFFRLVLAAATLGLFGPRLRADEPTAAAPTPLTAPQQASLETLDRAFARFDTLLARDDDARHRAATQATLDGLKHRRDALRAAFDASKCDDLRTELNLEYQRLAAWVGPAPSGN